MLRTDGDYTIYVIEHLRQNDSIERWVRSIENEHYFGAAGDCWQETGIHGTFDLEEAKRAFLSIMNNRKLLDRKFRLVRVRIHQSTEVVK